MAFSISSKRKSTYRIVLGLILDFDNLITDKNSPSFHSDIFGMPKMFFCQGHMLDAVVSGVICRQYHIHWRKKANKLECQFCELILLLEIIFRGSTTVAVSDPIGQD